MLFEEWLPNFERAARWNGWSEAERLIQLARHLKGKALQEWSLLDSGAYDNTKNKTLPKLKSACCSRFPTSSPKTTGICG